MAEAMKIAIMLIIAMGYVCPVPGYAVSYEG